jgi:hypothetical protein
MEESPDIYSLFASNVQTKNIGLAYVFGNFFWRFYLCGSLLLLE